MRRMIEKLLVRLFDVFPKRLDIRVKYCFVVSSPVIIYKAYKKSFLNIHRQPSVQFQKYYSETKKKFHVDQIPSDASDEQICVRFSGGTDSTLAAATMAPRFKRVHLLTFNTTFKMNLLGLINSDPSNASANADNLRRRFGQEKFVHRISNFGHVRNQIYFRDYLPHFPTRDFTRVTFCPACVMAMHIETIIYCLKNGIRYVSDGATIESGVLKWQTQNPYNMVEMRDFYKMFGLKYLINPNYYLMDSDKELYRLGIIERESVRKRYHYRRKTQQYCILIQFQSLCRRLHGRVGNSTASSFSEAGLISNYFRTKIPRYKQYIDSRVCKRHF